MKKIMINLFFLPELNLFNRKFPLSALKKWRLEDAERLLNDNEAVLLDVCTIQEYNYGHIDRFINIPLDELRERLDEIEPAKPVYVICQSGLRSHIASRILEGNGYKSYNFAEDYRFYDTVINDRALTEETYACCMGK